MSGGDTPKQGTQAPPPSRPSGSRFGSFMTQPVLVVALIAAGGQPSRWRSAACPVAPAEATARPRSRRRRAWSRRRHRGRLHRAGVAQERPRRRGGRAQDRTGRPRLAGTVDGGRDLRRRAAPPRDLRTPRGFRLHGDRQFRLVPTHDHGDRAPAGRREIAVHGGPRGRVFLSGRLQPGVTTGRSTGRPPRRAAAARSAGAARSRARSSRPCRSRPGDDAAARPHRDPRGARTSSSSRRGAG